MVGMLSDFQLQGNVKRVVLHWSFFAELLLFYKLLAAQILFSNVYFSSKTKKHFSTTLELELIKGTVHRKGWWSVAQWGKAFLHDWDNGLGAMSWQNQVDRKSNLLTTFSLQNPNILEHSPLRSQWNPPSILISNSLEALQLMDYDLLGNSLGYKWQMVYSLVVFKEETKIRQAVVPSGFVVKLFFGLMCLMLCET